jgi:hypothetical protein
LADGTFYELLPAGILTANSSNLMPDEPGNTPHYRFMRMPRIRALSLVWKGLCGNLP